MKAWERIRSFIAKNFVYGILTQNDKNAEEIILAKHPDELEEYYFFRRYKPIYSIIRTMCELNKGTEIALNSYLLKEFLYDEWESDFVPFIENDANALDILIECAIDNDVPAEYKLFLLDYKYKHKKFLEKDWRL